MPPPYGEAFSKETLIRSASSKAFAATTKGRIGGYKTFEFETCCNPIVVCLSDALICTGPDSDPLRDGFQATSLDQYEVEGIMDACIKHSDHWSGFKVAAIIVGVFKKGAARFSATVRFHLSNFIYLTAINMAFNNKGYISHHSQAGMQADVNEGRSSYDNR